MVLIVYTKLNIIMEQLHFPLAMVRLTLIRTIWYAEWKESGILKIRSNILTL